MGKLKITRKKKIIIGIVAILTVVAGAWGLFKIRAARKKHNKLPGDIPVR
ncbi:MAG: hypothetical protein ABSC54_00770 [Smithellaceae bacterium]|jgi:hypothetical protein